MTDPDKVQGQRRGAVSRRALCAGIALLPFSTAAFATEEDVRLAIIKDFGLMPIPEGDVRIDMPDFSDSGKSVPLTVTVPCSMQGLDYPEAVAVYAARNPRPRVLTAYFTPACSEATFSTRLRIDSYQDITVVVKMASGEVFKGVRKVDVTYGACEDAVANDQFPPGWSPRIRLSVPKIVASAAPFEVRTIIGHPMETGFRHNAQGLIIPARIAEWFRCFLGDAVAFSVKLQPAVAANPYFAFNLSVRQNETLHFEWIDTTSEIYSDEAQILVE
jgi:sulfur-oxidizing protein SoxY